MVLDAELPVSLDHLQRLTDCFGLIQHAWFALPDYRSGYTTDDNARALVVATKHYRLHGDPAGLDLATRYLAFLLYAQRSDGRFHNFMGYDRRPLDEVGSEDCLGRSFWALAWFLRCPATPGLVGPAEQMFHQALPWVERLEHPRARAFCLTALYGWVEARPEEAPRARALGAPLADYLVSRYREHSSPGWDWLLPEMTYDNAKLPEALFRAYQMTENPDYLDVARRTLDFLYRKTFSNDVLCLVGNHGWFGPEDQEPPVFDQQPVDAVAMVEASLAGFDATGDPAYLRWAWQSLEWFYGRNLTGVPLYDPETKGCFDALTREGVNQNRGAESTLALLFAQLSILEARQTLSRSVLSEGGAWLLPEREPARLES